MTSELDALKTNEFLRRRKLRIQQVREQSKDIAKKIRLRASAEKIRQFENINATKEKEFIEQRDKLINKLEHLHAQRVEKLGAGHKNAAEVLQQENLLERVDLSKQRAREAAAELKRQKQEKLDERKKLLDRKLHAREIANEISREKSSSVLNKLLKSSSKATEGQETNIDQISKPETVHPTSSEDISDLPNNEQAHAKVDTNEMGTQWDFDALPEWGQSGPLPLPTADSARLPSAQEEETQSAKSKRLNLFAVSDEMPSSLCGGRIRPPENYNPYAKSSLTLVSDYIQNRDLRFRDYESKVSTKGSGDLQSLKNLIRKTRDSNVAVPSKEKPSKTLTSEVSLEKKNSVTTYNHSTRDVRDVPHGGKRFVTREHISDEDAYSKAVKESLSNVGKDKEHYKKLQDIRSKIAMTKQSVEKEYHDTMAFLKSLPKDDSKPVKSAYRNAHQEKQHKENKQRKLQHEFTKIQKDCRKQTLVGMKPCSKTRSPKVNVSEQDFEQQDFQYSWMPVPESDKGLAVHIIPTKVKENKTGSSVKFSQIDSYHEYRSRHKHTPPTKDTCENMRQDGTEEESVDDQCPDSESSTSTLCNDSSEELCLGKKKLDKKTDSDQLSDAERIIIYKIVDKNSHKKHKVRRKFSQTNSPKKKLSMGSTADSNQIDNVQTKSSTSTKHVNGAASLAKMKEGLYKVVSENGDNIDLLTFDERGQKETALMSESQKDNGSGQITVGRSCVNTENNDSGSPNTRSSSSGFKTASQDKNLQRDSSDSKRESTKTSDKEPERPLGNSVKIIDDADLQTGKFFIGASGFLKDNNYEVVIQLRKADQLKSDVKDTSKDSVGKQTKSDPPATETLTRNEVKSVVNSETNTETIKSASSTQHVVANKPETSSQNERNLVDKSVDVPFQECVDRPEQRYEAKTSHSVSVQTAFDSADQRYFRVSSTSTTYMSPPESILPTYLHEQKSNYYENDYFHNVQRSKANKHDVNTFKKTKQCTKNNSPKSKLTGSQLRYIQRHRDMRQLPNTARGNYGIYGHSQKPCRKAKPTRKLKKCVKSNNSVPHLRHLPRKHTNSNILTPPPSREETSPETGIEGFKLRKHEYRQVIKSYVNKLLQMSREGVKAFNVINQDCSSMDTPGSSIIEVPHNLIERESDKGVKISLEQLKSLILEQIRKTYQEELQSNGYQSSVGDTLSNGYDVRRFLLRIPKKKSVHKVKSLNISRSLFSQGDKQPLQTKNYVSGKSTLSVNKRQRSKSSPSPRNLDMNKSEKHQANDQADINVRDSVKSGNLNRLGSKITGPPFNNETNTIETRTVTQKCSIEKEPNDRETIETRNDLSVEQRESFVPRETVVASRDYKTAPSTSSESFHSTQIHQNQNIDEEINLINLAENKLQNMEKIADLTEKCTKRLTNLAKVLEEVRRNKLSYSQASESTSDADPKQISNTQLPRTYEPIIEIKEKGTSSPLPSETPSLLRPGKPKSPPKSKTNEQDNETEKKVINKNRKVSPQRKRPKSPVFSVKSPSPHIVEKSLDHQIPEAKSSEHSNHKSRGKPPPASIRRCLKHAQEYIVPHELSTVLEIDSPSHRAQSAQKNTSSVLLKDTNTDKEEIRNKYVFSTDQQTQENNPDLLQTKYTERGTTTTDTVDNTKFQMMDLKQFNEIMLKPFISVQEYAQQCNIENLTECSNSEHIAKGDIINDDISSLHSDGSLPDVVAELLKRNIISEPFKFDSASNFDSVTASSDSSVLAMIQARKSRKKATVAFSNKEKAEDTSDTLSFTSNLDLENAFKQLGMGWASSTLRKTKEHLALSSSSNTSSSSQCKLKNVRSKEFPVLVTDSMSSIRNATNISGRKGQNNPVADESLKSAGQQTSLASALSVKQFLTKELAKRITFGDKSRGEDTEEEFVSLYETKMPEEMKNSSKREERSIDSNPRARTSTPVQLYKSNQYQSSSSSNMSNGLFSNADDLSSVKGTSNSMRNNSTSEKDDLTVPGFSLRTKKGLTDSSKSDDLSI